MKKKIILSIAAFALAASVFAGGIYVGAATTGAGSQNDPVVSLSYLEYRLNKLEGSGNSGAGSTDAGNAAAKGYRKVSLARGERLMPGEGSMIVVYSGNCTAVGEKGIINMTDGSLYQESYSLPLYNNFLVPADSSGIVAGNDVTVFVAD